MISRTESTEMFMGNGKFPKIERLAAMSEARKRELLLRSVSRMDEARPLVEKIIDEVQRNGDKAVIRYTKKFDRINLSPASIRVSKTEIRKAYREVYRNEPELISIMKHTIGCVKDYHEGEIDQLKFGIKKWNRKVAHYSDIWQRSAGPMDAGQLKTPISRIGLYVPGGKANLFSTAIMGVTPAKVVGVPEIVVASPPSRNGDIDPRIIVAADLAGATTIIRAGGAQAIAAMAFGTDSVPKVYKIFGPGNIYVAAAKSCVASSGICAIDFLAGPSEILVVADDSADAEWIARDLISQAEHDPNACAVLVTDSKKVATSVQRRIPRIIDESMTKGETERRFGTFAVESLSRFGAIVVVKNLEEAIEFANEFAPEHLSIQTDCPRRWLERVRNAGAIFLGHHSRVAMGDYICPNHILPTGGAARYTSGLNIDMFLKKPAVSKVPEKLKPTFDKLVEALSTAEGLYNQHGLSVKMSLRKKRSVRRYG